MSDLATLQRQFHRAIRCGDEGEILNQVKAGRLQPAEQLRIYRNNAYEGVRRVLAAAFPCIERLVGQGCFRGLALDYFHTYPSEKGDLGTYGQHFATLLKARYEHSTFDYLTDVAQLEWAYQEAMMAADANVLHPEDLAAVEPALLRRLRLHPHPAVRVVASQYPVLRIWRSNRDDYDSAVNININGGGESVLLYRTAHHIELRLLDAAEAVMIKACRAGRSLAEALERAAVVDPNFDSQHALQRAFAFNIFSDQSLLSTERRC